MAGRHAVNLVDEEDVALLQVGEERGEVAGLLDDGAGGRAQLRAHLVGDDDGERGLAQSGRPRQEHMVERLAPLTRGA